MSKYEKYSQQELQSLLVQKDIQIDVLREDINHILDTITPLAHEINNTSKFFKWFKYVRLVALLVEQIIKVFAKHKR